MRTRALVIALCGSVLVGAAARASVASDIEALTGSRTKIAYVRSTADPGTNWDCGGSNWELYVFDTAEGSERVLLPGPDAYRFPIVTADGSSVIWSDPDSDHIYMCNWDGSGHQELVLPMPGYLPNRATYAVTTAIDSQGILWVYAKNDVYSNCMRRYRLDDLSVHELVYDGSNFDARFTLSRDMTRGAFETSDFSPTRDVYVLSTATKSLEGPYDSVDHQSCNTQMAPDNSYGVFHFAGDHMGLTYYESGGANKRWISVSAELGFSVDIWAPRWSNDVRVFSCAGPLQPYADANVYVCKFDDGFTAVDDWVQVTTTSCSSMAHVWIEPPPPPTVDAFAASPANLQAGQSTTLSWQTTDATSVTLDGVDVVPDGSQALSPAGTSTYTLVAANGHSSVSQQVTVVVVTTAPVSIDSFSAQPAGRTTSGPATLNWVTSNATSVTLDGAAVNASSSATVDVSSTASYTLVANGAGGPVSKTITVNVGQVAGLVAHYACEGDALDSSGNGFDGTTVGGTSTIGGHFDSALGFDGTSSYATVGHDASLDLTGAMSVSCWVKRGSYAQPARIVGKGGIEHGPYDLQLQPDGWSGYFRWDRSGGGFAYVWLDLTTNGLPTGAWVHLVVTRASDGTVKLYRDTVLRQTNTDWSADDVATSTGALNIGGGADGAHFGGGIDDVRIYGYALDATEVAELHAGAAATGAVDIEHFTASPHSPASGQSATLSWQTTNATAVTLDGAPVASDGTAIVSPGSTTTYTLEAQGSCGPVSTTVTVSVGTSSAPAAIDTFTAVPDSIVAGESSTLTWTTSGAIAVALDGAAVDADGSVAVTPTATTTYTLTADGAGGTVSQDITVAVAAPTLPVTVDSFEADPSAVVAGHSTTISWTTSNATAVQLEGADVAPDGSVVAAPTATTTYTLVAQGTGGPVTQQVTVAVAQTSISISSPASGDVLVSGTQAHIRWTTIGIENVTILYSVDGGPSAWDVVLTSVTDQQPGWGDYSWTVPDTPSTECVVCVVGYFGDAPAEAGPFEIRGPADSDLDGMDDTWELDHFGDLLLDGSGDADDDGVSDLDEYLNGTDPTAPDALDALPVTPTMAWSCTPGASGAAGMELAVLALCLIIGSARSRDRQRRAAPRPGGGKSDASGPSGGNRLW